MNIGIYLLGSLGDTLVALPALWTIRHQYPDATVFLFTNVSESQSLVRASVVLKGAGVVDRVVEYPSFEGTRNRFLKTCGIFKLWQSIRALHLDTLIYLVQGYRDKPRFRRDLSFFRNSGAKRLAGFEGAPPTPSVCRGELVRQPTQADQFLFRLAASGIPVPPPGQGRADLNLGTADYAAAEAWRRQGPDSGGRRLAAFGPGTKMPSKQWPEDRFAEVGRRLIAEFDVWPIVFGGSEDRATGQRLIAGWGRGSMAAGELGIRASAAALEGCACYVGNDTGTMHLAASVGVRCVAVFSARDYPGLWEPYGPGHRVLRSPVPCSGCLAISCPEESNACLTQIGIEPVLEACRQILTDAGP